MLATFRRRARALAGASLAAIAFGSPAAARRHAVPAAAPATPNFKAAIFARGSAALFNPDGIVVTQHYVFVAWQNASDHTSAPSTIVKYSHAGAVLGTLNLNGRCDGLRIDPVTHELWALLNNDGLNGSPPRQPGLDVIVPSTLKATSYAFPKVQPHGGGYDDVAFVKGHAFLSASSETLPASGVNDKPVIVQAALSGANVSLKPIVYGNADGLDIVTGKTVHLNITDPDSMMVDASGDLVLDSQGDGQLLFVANPGTASQKLSRLGLGTQLDDSAWTTGTSGVLWVADSTANAVYELSSTFAAGSVFSEAPAGGPVQSFLGTLDPKTGILTPLLTPLERFVSPTSLIFVNPAAEEPDV